MKKKRIAFGTILFVSMVCLVFVSDLITAQNRSAPGARYRSLQQLDTLLMQLEQAYMNNNRQEMGRLIQEMKQRQEVYRSADMPLDPSRIEAAGPDEEMPPPPRRRGFEPGGRPRYAPSPADAGRGFFENPSIFFCKDSMVASNTNVFSN